MRGKKPGGPRRNAFHAKPPLEPDGWKIDVTIYVGDATNLPKLVNRTRGQHWAVTRKEKLEWYWRVAGAIPADRRPAEPLPYARVILTRISANEPDRDGLYGSFKSVLDSLMPAKITRSGKRPGIALITDDSSQHCQFIARWRKGKQKKAAVQIQVWEIPAPTTDEPAQSLGSDLAPAA